MGAYLSRTTEVQEARPASISTPNTAQQQKVTFAEPPASVAQPQTATAASEPVLQRRSSRPRMSRPPRAMPTVSPRRPKTARTPSAKPVDPSAAMVQGAFPATAAATPKATPRPRGGHPGTGRKASAKKAAAAAPPELVVVGKAVPHIAQPLKRQKGAVPAQKVNMKRVAKRALMAVGQKGGRGNKV